MVYKTRPRRRKVVRTKRKKMYKKRIPRLTFANPRMIYKAKLTAGSSAITVPTGQGFVSAQSYSFGDIVPDDLDGFIKLYDEIKITGVKIQIIPRGNVAQAGLTQDQGFIYYSVIDYSDDNTLSTVDEALQYASCRKHFSWRPMARYFPVKCPVLLKDVNNTNMIQTQQPQWLQLLPQTIVGTSYNNANVAHLGLKLISNINESDEDIIFDVYAHLYCQFRNKI